MDIETDSVIANLKLVVYIYKKKKKKKKKRHLQSICMWSKIVY